MGNGQVNQKQMDYRTTCLHCGWHVDTGVPYGSLSSTEKPRQKRTILEHLLECPGNGPVVITVRLA